MPTASILKALIESLGTNVHSFEKTIKVPRGRIASAIERNSTISGETIKKITEAYPSVNKDWLLTGEGDIYTDDTPNKTTGTNLRANKAFRGKKEEGLKFVPIKAQAGYALHYMDPVFLDELLEINIPGLPYSGDRYRAFEVAGESMQFMKDGEVKGLPEGMIIIAEKVEKEDWDFTGQYYIYVVVTSDRIMIKRLFRKGDKYALISDNELYEQFVLTKTDIKELWKLKRKLDWDMPPPKAIEIKVDLD